MDCRGRRHHRCKKNQLGMYLRLNSTEQDILTLMGIGEFLPSNWLVDCLSSLFCHEGDVTQGVCTSILFVLCGYDAEVNPFFLAKIFGFWPENPFFAIGPRISSMARL